MPFPRSAVAMLSMLLLAGCAAPEKELENVAKDWCLSIRASQVLPVYPLTEDLQPGDVFLVQTPIQKQVDIYKERGFLPLDQMVARLDGLDYRKYYGAGYFKWYFPGEPLDRPSPDPPDNDDPSRRFHYAPLPMAAFPSYAFSVDSGVGLEVALPVQGIPMGLGLMNTDSATGTITLSDGMTYALDTEQVLRRLYDWAADDDVRGMLASVRRQSPHELYLRTVTRVYLIGAVNVSLVNRRAGALGVDGGAAPVIEMPRFDTRDAVQARESAVAYRAALDTLGEGLSSSVPGGAIRIAYASGRGVTLKEKFPRLLAIGYLGFDCEIRKDGSLGPPLATRDVLDPAIGLKPVAGVAGTYRWLTCMNLYTMLGMSTEAEARRLAGEMDGLFGSFEPRVDPGALTWYRLDEGDDGTVIVEDSAALRGYRDDTLPGMRRLNALMGTVSDSIDAVTHSLEENGGVAEQDAWRQRLDTMTGLRGELLAHVSSSPPTQRAVSYAFPEL